MPLIAIALVTVAAVIHAFWNLLGKRQNPSAAFFLVASLSAAAVLLLPALQSRRLLALIPPSLWLLVAVSSVFEAVYYSALAGAYRNGDMSRPTRWRALCRRSSSPLWPLCWASASR